MTTPHASIRPISEDLALSIVAFGTVLLAGLHFVTPAIIVAAVVVALSLYLVTRRAAPQAWLIVAANVVMAGAVVALARSTQIPVYVAVIVAAVVAIATALALRSRPTANPSAASPQAAR